MVIVCLPKQSGNMPLAVRAPTKPGLAPVPKRNFTVTETFAIRIAPSIGKQRTRMINMPILPQSVVSYLMIKDFTI